MSGHLELRSDGKRRLAFASPFLLLTFITLATTWQQPRWLAAMLLFGVVIGGPLLWWGVAHRVEVEADRLRHHVPMGPRQEMSLADVELIDVRRSDRRWPFRSYVVTLATRQGDYLPFETANFDPAALVAFLSALQIRAPHTRWTGRAEDFLDQRF